MGSLSFLQGIFPTQELNWGLLHCRWILYQLSYRGALTSPLQRSQEVEELVGTPAEFLSSVTGKQHLLLSHCISVRLNGLILVEIVTGVSEVQWATFLMASE